ncbi:MAG: transglutaminase domain-containing protein [Candidatus ainarchaeum sp.]|nr:transglutaminase domain-containing protein [Candidatus ainarchaeum sp.]
MPFRNLRPEVRKRIGHLAMEHKLTPETQHGRREHSRVVLESLFDLKEGELSNSEKIKEAVKKIKTDPLYKEKILLAKGAIKNFRAAKFMDKYVAAESHGADAVGIFRGGIVKELKEGDVLPISPFGHATKLDLDNPEIRKLFFEVEEYITKYSGSAPHLPKSQKTDIALIAHYLYSVFEQSESRRQRIADETYDPGSDSPQNLSRFVQEKVGMCSELSMLAQVLLQKIGVESRYVAGEFRFEHTEENGGTETSNGPHSFNLIKIDDMWHILDVTNPLFDGGKVIGPYIVPIVFVGADASYGITVFDGRHKRVYWFKRNLGLV